jgi:hypothetical protein
MLAKIECTSKSLALRERERLLAIIVPFVCCDGAHAVSDLHVTCCFQNCDASLRVGIQAGVLRCSPYVTLVNSLFDGPKGREENSIGAH